MFNWVTHIFAITLCALSVFYALFLDKNESLDVQIYPTEEDVDVDDVLVEDAEVMTSFSQRL